jgi:small-conductance mechanosensitive channel
VRHLLLIALLLALTGPALAKVKKIFKTIGNDMYADPLYAQDFMQPFQSHGVYEVDDVGIVIRGKFMARPGRQFVLRKEIYDRVQREFEKHGIQFARREVRVRIDSTPERQAQAAGAAADAAPAAPPIAGTSDDR